MTDIPEDVRHLARSIALDVFANAVDSDDDSHSLDNAVAFDIIEAAIMADREKRVADPERMMKDVLFALVREGREAAQYGGVMCGDGKYAWMRFSVEPKEAPEPVNVDAINAGIELCARYHDDLEAQHAAAHAYIESDHHMMMEREHRRHAAAIRALKGEAK